MIRIFWQPLANAWHYRELIQVILWRELAARFRDSYFSWGWAVLAPVVMLGLYIAAFSAVRPGVVGEGGIKHYALSAFMGLLIFNLFIELISRAPTLLHEHAMFLKKSIFPSETLIWIASLRALVYAAIGFVVLLIAQIVLTARIPPTAILLPFVFAPLFLYLLGLSWFLAALGAFTRDISYLMVTCAPVMLFITPVFFTVADLPADTKPFAYLNPLTPPIEMSRQLLLYGTLPDPLTYFLSTAFALTVFAAGYAFFIRYRNVVVDVI
ncbi:MAG: ABC transporter permease [Pseudolabrys sp.]|nr:ABC transporter permease [Pseudolabrys sp.]